MADLLSLNNYQVQGSSLQLKNGWLEVLKLVALLLLKTGTFLSPKNWWEISVDAIFCFVEIFWKRKRQSNKINVIINLDKQKFSNLTPHSA